MLSTTRYATDQKTYNSFVLLSTPSPLLWARYRRTNLPDSPARSSSPRFRSASHATVGRPSARSFVDVFPASPGNGSISVPSPYSPPRTARKRFARKQSENVRFRVVGDLGGYPVTGVSAGNVFHPNRRDSFVRHNGQTTVR